MNIKNIDTPIDSYIVSKALDESGLDDLSCGSIREIVKLVNEIEEKTGEKYVRMEMGVPGIDAPQIAIEGEIEALKKGVASKYAMIDGVKPLKSEMSRFVKLFLNMDVPAENCVPTVGSMQGGFASFMTLSRANEKKDTILFIDPGFPVQKQQCEILNIKYETFDVYSYRGKKLKAKLIEFLSKGNIAAIVYSNPNNPSWICFTESELQIIGELANEYDTVIIEDLAYFGMDFRKDFTTPGEAPFQATVGKYTDNYIYLISSSKAFSYAGQRVGMLVISPELFDRKFPDLKRFYKSDKFGYTMIYGTLYPLSSGVTHSAQYGLAAILKAVNDGTYNYREDVLVYAERAQKMKELFLKNGFKLVYDKDVDVEIADGFYFTVEYPGMSGKDLLENLLYFGISAISLLKTGSENQNGLRACVSQVSNEQIEILSERLEKFHAAFG